MKKTTPPRWSIPSYSYDVRLGITKKRRRLPIALYLLSVSSFMVAAVFAASLQVKATPPPKAKVAPPAAIKTTAILHANPARTKSVELENNELSSIISQFVNMHSSHQWSIQLRGLAGDERTAAYESTKAWRSASVFKLLLMYPLIQRVPMTQWDSIDLNVQGKTKTLNDCVTAMLKVSNNACGKAVGDYVGWEYADAELKVIGLEKTRLNSDLGPMTTAADVAYYLQGLYEGKWFDGASRDFIIKTLDQQILRAGIPHGCGSGCAVADKTGDLGFVRHDAAIVRYAGGAYVLSVFSDGASYADISGLAAQIQAYIDAG